MDATLLSMFVDIARARIVGTRVGVIRWLRPVLSLPLRGGRGTVHLVAILECPGPFCYLADQDPLGGVDAPSRFGNLTGAVVRDVSMPGGERCVTLVLDETVGVCARSMVTIALHGAIGQVETVREDRFAPQPATHAGAAPHGSSPGREKPPPTPAPFYLLSSGRPGRVKPAPEDDPGVACRYGPFRDALEGCRAVGRELFAETARRIISGRLRSIERRAANRRTLLVKLSEASRRAEEHVRVRHEAETLAAFQSRIRPGSAAVDLPDVYDPERIVRITLDPAVPVRVEIDRRFKLAGKLERSSAHTQRRTAEVQKELEDLESAVEHVETCGGFAEAMRALDRITAKLPRVGERARRSETAIERAARQPFRRFDLDPMWFVLVGRSDKENETLTFREAAPTDLWLHAQHVPGSHVVLKARGNPGRPPAIILEQAASIAAYYSRARHSSLVPVVYTLRKYVRKPRGAPRGQVICTREKSVMAVPRLPKPHSKKN